jgi:hypothetical protein
LVLVAFVALTALLRGGWARPVAADVEGNTYTSTVCDYSLTWDDTWFVMEESFNDPYDYLLVTNGATYAHFYCGPDPIPPGSTEAALASQVVELNMDPTVSNIERLPDVRFVSDDRAYAAYSFTQKYEDGSTEKLVGYFEARPIDPGRVYLTIYAFMPAEDFEAERPQIEALLAGLNPTPGPGPEPTQTPKPGSAPTRTPEGEVTLLEGEPAPVFVSGTWRVAVAAAALNIELGGVKLKAKSGKAWLVVVLDVTNWSDKDARLSAEDLEIRIKDRAKPIGIAPASTTKVAARLDLAPSTEDFTVAIAAGETTRIVVVYSLPAGSKEPALRLGEEAIPLDDVLRADLAPADLPKPAGPPATKEAKFFSAADGTTLNVQYEGETRSERVNLLGVEAPDETSCPVEKEAQLFAELAGTTVLIEADDALSGGARPAVYVWLLNDDGTRTLLNQHLIAEGLAGAVSIPADARFGLWLKATAADTEKDQIGLLTGCLTKQAAPGILAGLPSGASSAGRVVQR